MTTTLTRPKAPQPLNGQRPSPAPEPVGRRNRARMMVGLVVLVLCVLGAITLYGKASDRIEVLAVRRPVAPGQQITAEDIGTVSITVDSNLRTMSVSQRAEVVGQIALVGLVPGSLLAPSQINDGPRVPAGMVITGATLKPGQFPIGLRAGDDVLLVETPLTTATGAAAEPITRGNAQVLEVERLDNATSSLAVSLIVPATSASSIASAGAGGRLTLVVVGAR